MKATSLLPWSLALAAAKTNGLSAAKRDLDLKELVSRIADIFPFDAAISAVCDVITKGEEFLAADFGIEISSSRSACADVALIFARGTCDPGNLGALVGPPFVQELQNALGFTTLSVQGVEYAASVNGYLDDDPAGGQTMANLISATQKNCPNSKIVLGGYSQGGYVVHNAASSVGSAMSTVRAVVIFGDPDSHEAVSGIDAERVKIICHDGDDICDQGDIILPQHLTYAIDAVEAAEFVVARL